MTKKLFLLTIALLCSVAQGAWADTWDGHTTSRPDHNVSSNGFTIYIKSSAELAYLRDNWKELAFTYPNYSEPFVYEKVYYYQCNIELQADLDMSVVSWKPIPKLEKSFNGNGHTIRLNISGATDNYQGLFEQIASGVKVADLHVAGNITCTSSRLVGGIAGENDGTIENCWVSADVSSDWSNSWSGYTGKVGGICGENNGTVQFCCMSGNVTNNDADVGGLIGDNKDGTLRHSIFYGIRNSTHVQDSKFVGDSGTEESVYDTFVSSELNVGGDLYHNAIQHPYSVSISTSGTGTMTTSEASAYPGKSVTLNVTSGTLEEITIKNADGNDISFSGNATDGYTFTMPNRDVNVMPVFDTTDWDDEAKGTEADPYIIDKSREWDDFVNHVNNGKDYSGKYVKLIVDISVTQKCGTVLGSTLKNGFSGIFLGDGHTITAAITDTDNQGTALFSYIDGAYIKDLNVTGTVSGGLYAAAIAGFAKGTGNRIENCTVTANVSGGTHIGGILGHGLSSQTDITGCIFSGKMTGGSTAKGAIYGWGDTGGLATITNCLYLKQDDQDTEHLDVAQTAGGSVTVTDTYKTANAGTYGWYVYENYPSTGLCASIKATDGNTYYMAIGATTDNATYQTNTDMTVASRIIVCGTVTLNLGAGTTLHAPKGIELSKADHNANLTINGPGALTIDGCNTGIAGIGAISVGTLTINGGTINVNGGPNGAGIGGSKGSTQGGTIIINGGVVNATGGSYSAGIGCSEGLGNPCSDIVINGGQVTAIGTYANGIGPGTAAVASLSPELPYLTYPPSGTLKLGWSNPDDFVYIGKAVTNLPLVGYLESITFAEGKQFYLDHTSTIATADNLYGYKLFPFTDTLPVLSLADDVDNSDAISTADGKLVDVTLADRTLYKDGSWNTLCLPFSLTAEQLADDGCPLKDATIKTLDSSSFADGTLTLNFTNATTVEAGKPYIVKWDDGSTQNIVNPIFEGVTISSTAATETDGSDWVDFVGTYSPTVIYENGNEKHNLYLGSSNKLYYPTRTGFTVNACRAYFRLKNGLTAGEPSAPQQALARAFVLNFGDGEPSAISTLRADTAPAADGTYTLDGRRLSGRPTAKGLYIVNGKKIIIK